MRQYKLNNTHRFIMDYFWHIANNQAVSANDVIQYSRENGKDWSEHAVRVFLRDLVKKGMIEATRNERILTYVPLITEEEFELMPIKKLIKKRYNGSIADFACSLYNLKDFEDD